MEKAIGYGWDNVYIPKNIIMRFICDHWGIAEPILKEGGYTMEKAQEVKDAASFGDAIAFDATIADYASDTNIYGPMGIIAKIIEIETGVRIQYIELWFGESCMKSILFPYLYAPWDLSPIEKELRETDLMDIFSRYMDELGNEDACPGPIYIEI